MLSGVDLVDRGAADIARAVVQAAFEPGPAGVQEAALLAPPSMLPRHTHTYIQYIHLYNN